MSEPSSSPGQLPSSRPRRVQGAIVLLWVSWSISVCALGANALLFQGGAAGVGLVVGVLMLLLQASVIQWVGSGSRIARALFLVFMFLAIPGLLVLGKLIADTSVLSALATVVGFTLKAVAVFLLFTGASAQWFAKPSGQEGTL